MNLIEGNQQLQYGESSLLFLVMRAAIYVALLCGCQRALSVEVKQADSAQKQEFCNPFRAIAGNRPLRLFCASPTLHPLRI